MESIGSIASSRTPKEPAQVSALKQYAHEKHGISISVFSSKHSYLVRVPTAALAHAFRIETADIAAACKLDRRLVIHIGS